jgi:hypothetical protein
MFYKSLFAIEDWFGPFEGWTTGQHWNGWECPYFEFETAIWMVDAWNRVVFDGAEYQARYDEERDEFCFINGGQEEWDCFGAQMKEIEGKTVKVYPIGAFCWIWSETTGSLYAPPEPKPNQRSIR